MNRYTLKSLLTQLVVRKLLPAPLLGECKETVHRAAGLRAICCPIWLYNFLALAQMWSELFPSCLVWLPLLGTVLSVWELTLTDQCSWPLFDACWFLVLELQSTLLTFVCMTCKCFSKDIQGCSWHFSLAWTLYLKPSGLPGGIRRAVALELCGTYMTPEHNTAPGVHWHSSLLRLGLPSWLPNCWLCRKWELL